MIDKNELENGVYYFGTCRNTKIAMWLDNKFIFIGLQFNRPYIEEIEHYQDVKELNLDGFIPIRKLDFNYDEIKDAKVTQDYNMSARKIYKNLNIKNLHNEIWREIQGYDGIYHVSNYGRVKKNNIKILKQNFSREYLILGLTKNGKRKTFRVHRLVAMAFKSNEYINGCEVNHINGIKTDNRVLNLEWVTHSENLKKVYYSGNRVKKLTPDIVKKIKIDLNERVLLQKDIAKKYNVSTTTICEIKTHKKWVDIK